MKAKGIFMILFLAIPFSFEILTIILIIIIIIH